MFFNPNQAGWWWLSPPPLVFDLPFQIAKRLWFLLWWLFKLKGLTPPERIILQVCYQKFWEISQERHLVSLDFDQYKANFKINPFLLLQNILTFHYSEFCIVSAYFLCLYTHKMEHFELFLLIIRKYIKLRSSIQVLYKVIGFFVCAWL